MCTFQDTPLIQGARKQFYIVLKVKLYFFYRWILFQVCFLTGRFYFRSYQLKLFVLYLIFQSQGYFHNSIVGIVPTSNWICSSPKSLHKGAIVLQLDTCLINKNINWNDLQWPGMDLGQLLVLITTFLSLLLVNSKQFEVLILMSIYFYILFYPQISWKKEFCAAPFPLL